MIDKWVSEGSGWVIDRIDSHYINVTTYKPSHRSSYKGLPTELSNPKKGLINIKNKDDECFRWCHIRHLNPQEKDPQRIKKEDKKMINELNYEGIEFPVSQKHYNKVEKQNSIRIKNKMTIYSFTIRHSFPNLLYVTYLHDVLYVCATSILSLFSQRDHNENKVYPDLYYAIPATVS